MSADAHAVFRDAASGGWQAHWKPVQHDTLFMGFSVVKGVTATCLMSCVDESELAYDQPISSVWPAFAGGGKQEITVADAVSHRAGLDRPTLGAMLSQLLTPASHDAGALDHVPRAGVRELESNASVGALGGSTSARRVGERRACSWRQGLTSIEEMAPASKKTTAVWVAFLRRFFCG